LDLAILGNGFFVVSSGNALFYTRAGQFQRDGDGRLVTAQGLALQAKGGGDLVLGTDKAWKVLEDGTVVEDGQSTARLAVVTLEDPKAIAYADNGALSAPSSSVASLDAPVIRQGAYEASNVSGASEMVAIMLALRQAETGQKLVSVYDDLMGRVIENLSTAGGG
jgi:flagellar basal body rod protein FlgG